jgi:hypothetical protein
MLERFPHRRHQRRGRGRVVRAKEAEHGQADPGWRSNEKGFFLFPLRAYLVLYPFLRFYWVVLTKHLLVSYWSGLKLYACFPQDYIV